MTDGQFFLSLEKSEMPRTHLYLIMLCLYLSANGQNPSGRKTCLIIVHPTKLVVGYYHSLVSKGMLPDTIEYIGIFHEDEEYDYSQVPDSDLYPCFKFKMIEVRGGINDADVYRQNSCSYIFDSLFNISDGIIFNGGPDIQSILYQEETSLLTRITDPARHRFEMSFIFHLLGSEFNPKYSPLLEKNTDYLILGICLGMQTMVAATGGALIQDIPTEIYKMNSGEQVIKSGKQHKNYYRHINPLDETICPGCLHRIKFLKNSGFWNNCHLTDSVLVYSYHHQSVGKLPKILKAIAWSEDKKVIEAVAHTSYQNVIGIQFHPELDALYNPGIIIYPETGDTLTLGSKIKNDQKSTDFYSTFWKQISDMLKR